MHKRFLNRKWGIILQTVSTGTNEEMLKVGLFATFAITQDDNKSSNIT